MEVNLIIPCNATTNPVQMEIASFENKIAAHSINIAFLLRLKWYQTTNQTNIVFYEYIKHTVTDRRPTVTKTILIVLSKIHVLYIADGNTI